METIKKNNIITNYFHKALKVSAGFWRYATNTAWVFSEKVLRIISGILIGIWVARYLGPEDYGIFSYSLAFVSIFGVIAKMGLDQYLVKSFIDRKQDEITIMGTSFWLKQFGALFSVLLIILFVWVSNLESQTTLYIFIIGLSLFFQAFLVIESNFESKVQGKYISLCKFWQLFLSAIFKIFLIILEVDLIWFVFLVLIDSATLGIMLFFTYWIKNKNNFISSFDWNLSKSLLKNSWPYILTGLSVVLYMRVDQIMLLEMAGAERVGIYSAAVAISGGWYFIPTIISASVVPAILNAKKTNEKLYQERLQSLFDLVTVISITAGIVCSIFSKDIIYLLYGDSYKEASSVLSVSIWAGVFVSLGIARGKWVLAEKLQRYSPISTFVGLIVNVILNFWLIPLYGIQGAAVATLFSQMTVGLIFPLIFKPFRSSSTYILKSLFFISIGKKMFKIL